MAKLLYKFKSTAAVTSCSLIPLFGYGVYRNDSKFYDQLLMPIIQLCPPELSHRVAVLAFKYHLIPKQKTADSERLRIKFLEFTLENPIGIAAGFDKHAEAVSGLHGLGFGFVEIGSVTPTPQPGNERPRVFRLTRDKAIVNRYGFNSEGHDRVLGRITRIKSKSTPSLVLGVNLGKNKTTQNAYEDYVEGINKFASVADYFVINVSSPNTVGLRDLQQADNLRLLLQKTLSARDELKIEDRKPILLKLSPDLDETSIKDVVKVISTKGCKVDGLIISNTTINRGDWLKSKAQFESGGLSGAPLKDESTVLIAKIYKMTDGKIPIIGVGGIFSGQDAYEKIAAGSSAVQLYTSLVYHGPPIVAKIKKELDEILQQNGFDNVEKARGTQADTFANV